MAQTVVVIVDGELIRIDRIVVWFLKMPEKTLKSPVWRIRYPGSVGDQPVDRPPFRRDDSVSIKSDA